MAKNLSLSTPKNFPLFTKIFFLNVLLFYIYYTKLSLSLERHKKNLYGRLPKALLPQNLRYGNNIHKTHNTRLHIFPSSTTITCVPIKKHQLLFCSSIAK